MKRSPLARRTPLKRTGRLRARPKRLTPEDARQAWKEPKAGYCQCGCQRFAMHLERHHVVYQQHVHKEHGAEWNLSNSMLVHPHCHSQHHAGARRIPIEHLPEAALAFAVDLLGEARAALYLSRYYATGRL